MQRSWSTVIVAALAVWLCATSAAAAPAVSPALVTAADETVVGPTGQLLFTSMRTGVMQIYRIDTDGGREVKLSQTDSADVQPAWSASGKIAFVSYRSGGGDIYTMNADGGELRRLTTQPGLDESPTWSPDGQRIAYVSERNGLTGVRVVQADGSQDILVSAALVEVGAPAWSPDGKKLAFVATQDSKLRIIVADLAAGTVGPVTEGKSGEFGPVWSVDGRSLAYVQSGNRTEGVNLRLFRLGESTSMALTSGGYTNSQPRFSPDGSRILYLSNASSQGASMNVHVMNADGTGITNLTRWEHADLSATWSGDGRQVLFMSFRDWPGQIYRVNADGSDVQRLTRSNGQDGYPVSRPSDSARSSVARAQ